MISEAGARAATSSWPKLPEVARHVLLEVLVHGPLSRAEIAAVTDLTAAQHWFGPGAGLQSPAVITVGAGVGTG
ncbi:hypothetical protein ACFYOT_31700 [Saccharothrix saharensis]|uniref:hypothetical protein n=1 Tax=Saccharothrix saharensis TaxID=571190 RepID=UPI0036A06AFE